MRGLPIVLCWIPIQLKLVQGPWWIIVPAYLFACIGFDRIIGPDLFIEDTRTRDFVAEELSDQHKAVESRQSHPGDASPNPTVEQAGGCDGEKPRS